MSLEKSLKMKQKIIVTVGISGSGKSTWATEMCKNHDHVRRVNRDDLRKSLVGTLEGYYQREDLWKLEEDVTEIIYLQIDYLLKQGYDLIIDNTHLSLKYINRIQLTYEKIANIKIKTFDVDLEQAKRNVLKRDFNCITDDEVITDERVDYINKQFDSYHKLIKKL